MLIGVRLLSEPLARIDAWAAHQVDHPNRPEAIRRLLELALNQATPRGRLSEESRAEASAMASKTIDRLTDTSASTKEQERRRGRLIKGPLEFRDVRQDQAAVKPRAKAKRKATRS